MIEAAKEKESRGEYTIPSDILIGLMETKERILESLNRQNRHFDN